MTTNSSRHTAKIYQFPAGGRAAYRGKTPVAKHGEEPAVLATQRPAVGGGSWYHEEAIREAEKARKR